ncbi:hypothetical protein [Enterovirga sp.]|uniref:hypothetical protein n=1 Tax=Enterovirga sp. TaxID=2026350 RepID=UPI002BCE3A42|nr:hypothetical protein [Enterovirga sp.]HMO30292.1 hypothetical protein [Enterovirga sp.]
MEVEIVDLEVAAATSEGRADRPAIIGEYAIILVAADGALLLDEGPGVVAGGGEEGMR